VSFDATCFLASITIVNTPDEQSEEAADPDACRSCGGRGWKFSNFRRSVSSAGDAGERATLGRTRIPCLACDGQVPADDEAGGDE
jgi:hypothetical protein